MLRTWVLVVMLAWLPELPFLSIGKANRLKQQAEASFREKNYLTAMVQYRYLRYNYQPASEEISLNLAHCYFLLGDTTNARKQYVSLQTSPNPAIRTIVLQQLGVLAYQYGKREQARNLFKSALKADPFNEGARYNFELLSASRTTGTTADTSQVDIPPAPPPPPPDSAAYQPNEEDAEPEEPGNAAGTPPPSVEAELSPERAEMLLKAIQSQETEYLRQQQKSSSKRIRSQYQGPDW